MKKAVGIIAEYNPFHNGHAYQIEQSKELTRSDIAVVLMSGDFVQRGTPAIFSKHERAKMALLGGADIVLELPGHYATSSAEFFAKGGVGIFHALNCIDFLSFGSESGDISSCLAVANVLLEEPPLYCRALKEALKQGASFPVARKTALKVYSLNESLPINADFLDTPNNILGIEYCKALLAQKSGIRPVTIERKGSSYHSKELHSQYPSASAIRNGMIKQTSHLPFDFSAAQPPAVWEYMESLLLHGTIITEDDFSLLLKYQLMQHHTDSLAQYADLSLDLCRRIYRQLNSLQTFSQFVLQLKTKELTHTRISRGLLHAILGISASMPGLTPSYVRLLGFKKDSSYFLRKMQKHSRIPIITKAADYHRLLKTSDLPTFEKDLFLADLYESVRSIKKQTAFVNDLQKPPVIL